MSEASPAGEPGRIANRFAAFRLRLAAAGWRRTALAAAFGIVATGALPPVYAWPLVFVSFSGLIWLLDLASPDRGTDVGAAFAVGWWFAFGHFVTNLYWLANALLLDAAQFGWMVPFAVFGLSAVLAVFVGAAAAVRHYSRCRGLAGILVFAVAWTAAEWLRGHVLTGFPWNLIGTVWVGVPAVMQSASLVGIYGLGMLTVTAASLPATLVAPTRVPRRWLGPIVAAALVCALWAFGLARLPAGDTATVPDIRLRLVQPNVTQSLKWDAAQRLASLRRSAELTRGPGFETRTDVIWPESAVPYVLTDLNRENPQLRAALAPMVPPGGLLITGALRAEHGADDEIKLWNSLFAIDPSGAVAGVYDKHHLVPFGEYVPFPKLLGFTRVAAGAIDFSAGPGPRTMDLPSLPPTSPLICYEAIFPQEVSETARRPAWLLNISNDAWFGLSAGPYQHFAAARFRAVEQGLPLVRATNDGISAVVDAYGRVLAHLDLGTAGVIDASLPIALAPTLYARVGDYAALGLGVILLLIVALIRRHG